MEALEVGGVVVVVVASEEAEKKQSSLPPEKKSLSWSSVKKLRLVKKWYFKNACFHPLLYFFPQKVSALSFSSCICHWFRSLASHSAI